MTDTPVESPVSPYLTVAGGKAALDFYARAFGAQELSRQEAPDGDKLFHAAFVVNGGIVMLSDDFPEMNGGVSGDPKSAGLTTVTIHLTVPDDAIEGAWQRAVGAGATVVMPLDDAFWGSKYGVLEDPFGHRWSFGTPQRPVSEEELRRGMEDSIEMHKQ